MTSFMVQTDSQSLALLMHLQTLSAGAQIQGLVPINQGQVKF